MSDPLQSWMAANHETDETLAAKLGVSRVQVSRIRRHICNPSPATAVKLAELTTIPAGDLLLRARAAGARKLPEAAVSREAAA